MIQDNFTFEEEINKNYGRLSSLGTVFAFLMGVSIFLFFLSIVFLLVKSQALFAWGLMLLPVSVSAVFSSIISFALLKALSVIVFSIGSMANDLSAMRPKDADQPKQSPNLIEI